MKRINCALIANINSIKLPYFGINQQVYFSIERVKIQSHSSQHFYVIILNLGNEKIEWLHQLSLLDIARIFKYCRLTYDLQDPIKFMNKSIQKSQKRNYNKITE